MNLGVLTCDQVLEPSIASPPIDILSTIFLDDYCIQIAMDSSDLVQQQIHCILDLVSWDEYLTNISNLFVESYIIDLGDTIDDIHLFFGEDDCPLVVAREHANPHLHSLLHQSFKVYMMVDPLI